MGTVTPELVEQRAREIARIEGRSPEQVTEDDLQEARAELLGENTHPEEDEDRTLAGSGHKAEKLVADGVEEAAHDQMLAAQDPDASDLTYDKPV